MLGVLSASTRSFAQLLEEAPRSMAMLSNQHPDGWGIALRRPRTRWTVHRSLLRAANDQAFHDLSAQLAGNILLVHVRQKTRGDIAMENTHPFESAPWVFTHNGTVNDVTFLEEGISPERRAQIRGDTDSERLFGFIMTRLDEARVSSESEQGRVDRVLRALTRELERIPGFGTASFLLSDGRALYAHRQGAPLHLLRRRSSNGSECSNRLANPCIAITTEPITDEHWIPLDDGDLVRVTRDPEPMWLRL